MLIPVSDLVSIFPRPLTEDEEKRAAGLISRALDLIEMEFIRAGRDLPSEMVSRRDTQFAVRQAVSEMVSRAILVGGDEGRASASSTTGPQSDSITWSQGVGIRWAGIGMDDSIRRLLGLVFAAMPRGKGGVVVPYGRLPFSRGRAEFAERRWS